MESLNLFILLGLALFSAIGSVYFTYLYTERVRRQERFKIAVITKCLDHLKTTIGEYSELSFNDDRYSQDGCDATLFATAVIDGQKYDLEFSLLVNHPNKGAIGIKEMKALQ